jgi:hypothetical protein
MRAVSVGWSRLAWLCLAAVLLILPVSGVSASALDAGAYVAVAVPHYQHPVTGAVEDAGNNPPLGQSMCESTLYPQALIEKDAKGGIYATLRLNLMDNIENISFRTQKAGKGSYQGAPAAVTQEDLRNNRSDFRIRIPGENVVVRVTFFVKPMGRDVIFYVTFKGLKGGKGDFVAEKAAAGKEGAASGTGSSAGDAGSDAAGQAGNGANGNGASGQSGNGTDGNDAAGQAGGNSPSGGQVDDGAGGRPGEVAPTGADAGEGAAGNSASAGADGAVGGTDARALIAAAQGLTGNAPVDDAVALTAAPPPLGAMGADAEAAGASDTGATGAGRQAWTLGLFFAAVVLVSFCAAGGYYLYYRGVLAGRRLARGNSEGSGHVSREQ